MPDVAADETLDILCNDRLHIIQKKAGYRFSLDPFLLANFVSLKKHERLLDVGSGCGIIPIYLSKKGYGNPMTGVEIQEELHELAVRNKELNGCPNVEFLRGDVKQIGKGLSAFHVIVSNPPYVRERTGRKSPGYSRFIARYETALRLSELLDIASSLLLTRGRLYLVYPSERLAEVISATRSKKLEPKRMRLVYSRQQEPARLSLIECVKGSGVSINVEPPFYIYSGDDYTQEVKNYYG
jgi:tRNA1Val (adenine37-N6)-methyltransferase